MRFALAAKKYAQKMPLACYQSMSHNLYQAKVARLTYPYMRYR